MSDRNEEERISLVDQLGTSLRQLLTLEWDMRKLGYIAANHRYYPNFKRLHFLLVKSRVMKHIEKGEQYNLEEIVVDEFLNLSNSLDGRGATMLLRGEQVKQGLGVDTKSDIPPPSFVDKILNRKKVEAYEQQEMEKLDLK